MANVSKIKLLTTTYDIKDNSGTKSTHTHTKDQITDFPTISSAGNAVANTVVARNANGSIQTEKLAISSGTTTKATIQYNTTDDCIDFIFS